MNSYKQWADEIVRKVGTMGAQQVIVEIQRNIDSLERNQTVNRNTGSTGSYGSLGHQISSVERGNITQR